MDELNRRTMQVIRLVYSKKVQSRLTAGWFSRMSTFATRWRLRRCHLNQLSDINGDDGNDNSKNGDSDCEDGTELNCKNAYPIRWTLGTPW